MIVLRYQDDNPRYVLDTIHIQEGWAMFGGQEFVSSLRSPKRERRIRHRVEFHPIRQFLEHFWVTVPLSLCARLVVLVRLVDRTPPSAGVASGVGPIIPPDTD